MGFLISRFTTVPFSTSRTMASLGDEGFVRLGQSAIICQPFASAQFVSSVLSMGHSADRGIFTLMGMADRKLQFLVEFTAVQNDLFRRNVLHCADGHHEVASVLDIDHDFVAGDMAHCAESLLAIMHENVEAFLYCVHSRLRFFNRVLPAKESNLSGVRKSVQGYAVPFDSRAPCGALKSQIVVE